MSIELPANPGERQRHLLAKFKGYADDYRLRIANVRKIHQPAPHNKQICVSCFHPLPCPTLRACDGVNEQP